VPPCVLVDPMSRLRVVPAPPVVVFDADVDADVDPAEPVEPVVPVVPVAPDAMLLTLDRARSYASRPRSAIWLTLSDAC